jgi:hypothetical protein
MDETTETGEESASLLDTLVYGLSLPERATRSLSAVVGGLVGETASRVIPLSFQSSRSYRTFIRQSLDLLVHDVGGMAKTKPADPQKAQMEASLARKAVGSLLDIAGTATMHLSPMTFLAVFNDLAYGSNAYLKQLADELRREGVIDEHSTIKHVSDLLEAMAKTSDRASSAAEAPPFDVEGLRETVEQLKTELAKVDPTTLVPQTEIKRLWEDMESIASASNMGVWQVSTTVAMHAMNRIDLATRGTLASIRVAGNLLDQHILDHYVVAIEAIRRDGLFETIRSSSAPYIDAVWDNFSMERSTWTSDFLTGKWFTAAKNWFSSDDEK